MRKAIVVSAIGPQYTALFRNVAPTFEHYAARHGWDIKVITELPDWFRDRYARPEWDFRLLCCAFRLHQPSLFPGYDLLALMDPDMIINPQAPCLSGYWDDIPAAGIAAVQEISFEERSLFPSWRKYHYSDFLSEEEVQELPFPDRHINTGLILLRPYEVMEELSALNLADSSLSDEDHINLSFTQRGRVFFLSPKWNVIYPYELARRGCLPRPLPHSRWRIVRKARDELDLRVTQPRLVKKLFNDAYVLHFASTDKRIPMHLDARRLLSTR
jgi:hypothetical protein